MKRWRYQRSFWWAERCKSGLEGLKTGFAGMGGQGLPSMMQTAFGGQQQDNPMLMQTSYGGGVGGNPMLMNASYCFCQL